MRKLQKRAEKVSFNGEHKLHRIGAVVASKKMPVSSGWNKNKTHPKSTHPWKFVHAEMDAIMKAGKECFGADLYVARIGKDGKPRNAKPCSACMAFIVASGIKNVYFTNDGGWYKVKIT